MALTESTAAFNAFEKQLKTLCLKEFPCGIGTWVRNGRNQSESLLTFNFTLTPVAPLISVCFLLHFYIGTVRAKYFQKFP